MSYTEQTRTVRAAQGGAYVSENPESDAERRSLAPVFARELQNIDLHNDVWEPSRGTRRLNPDFPIENANGENPVIQMVWDFEVVPGIHRLIAADGNGNIWKSEDDGITWRLIRAADSPSGLTAGGTAGEFFNPEFTPITVLGLGGFAVAATPRP